MSFVLFFVFGLGERGKGMGREDGREWERMMIGMGKMKNEWLINEHGLGCKMNERRR